jgi:Ca-activated chloride channel homolog
MVLMRFLAAAVFFELVLQAVPAKGQEPEPSFRTGVSLVVVDAAVTDSKGAPVGGLGPQNFEIKVDGRPREVSRFSLGTGNLSLALAVDYSGSMKPRRGAVIESVQTLASLLLPKDQAVLLVFNDRPVQLGDLVPADSLNRSWTKELLERIPDGQTTLYDAVIQASKALRNSAYERRVVLVVSDGEDTASYATLKDAVKVLRSSNSLLYCIGLFRPGDAGTNASALRQLAESTGGIALFDENRAGDLPGLLEKVIRDLRARYVLEFRSADAPPGKTVVRKLSVSARDRKGKRLRVRSRDEFRVAGPPENESPDDAH